MARIPRPNSKGRPKMPGCGRKRGTLNKATVIRNSLDKQEAIMQMLFEQARDGKSINAARIWLEQCNANIETVVEADVNTLEDIKNAGAKITQMMLRNELSLERGAKAHDALTKQKSYIEAQLTPIVDALIKERLDQMKMKD